MKSCNPRRWCESRFVIGGLLLAMLVVLLALVTRSVPIGLAAGVLLALSDLIVHRAGSGPSWRDCDARVWIEGCGEGRMLRAETVITLHAQLRCDHRLRTIMVMPLLPRSLHAVSPAGRVVRREDRSLDMSWTITGRQTGSAVVAGLLLVTTSPLGLFRSLALVPARTALFLVKTPEGMDPLLQLFKQRTLAGEDRRRLVRGGGTDFRELRQYQPMDPLTRIDWKATARRGELIVRDMEEPGEFAISVVLDASIDLTHGFDGRGEWFARSLHLLGALASVASRADLQLIVTVYDEGFLQHMQLARGAAGVDRLLAALTGLPRAALLRHLKRVEDQHPLLDRLGERRLRSWGIERADAEAFLDQYMNGGSDGTKALHTLLADTEPAAVLNLDRCCAVCNTRTFSDESACPKCGTSLGEGGLSLRAQMAVVAIAEALHRVRGRQMLVVVSSLCGGEMAPRLGEVLARTQAQHRAVHVVAPSAMELLDSRPQWPGSLGHGPIRRDVLRDMERLAGATRYTAFCRSLSAAGIAVHSMDDSTSMQDLVQSIITRELHVG